MAIKINGDNSTSAVGLSGGDNDSGVKPGTDQVEIVTGGTSRVTVGNSNTTVATTLTASAKLDAGGGGTSTQNQAIVAHSNAAASDAHATIYTRNMTADGNVFVGVDNSGQTRITLKNNGQAEFENRVKIQRTDSDTSAALLIVNAAGSTNQHIFYGNGQASFGGGETAIGASGELNTNQNIVLNSGGHGIKFPASNTGNADANTLDDYEEGTWTPQNQSNSSFSSCTGFYRKVGSIVHCMVSFQGTSLNGVSTIKNFPFTGKMTQYNGMVSLGYVVYIQGGLPASFSDKTYPLFQNSQAGYTSARFASAIGSSEFANTDYQAWSFTYVSE